MNRRLGMAVVLPFLALALQWLSWPWVKPFVWFFFIPALFFSAQLGGRKGGLAGSVLGAVLVWYFFIPPQLSWSIADPDNAYSVGLFLVMGWLFGAAGERLNRARQSTEDALAQSRLANDKLARINEKLRASRATLNAEVERRKRSEKDLRQRSTELERSNQELEDFAYVASHDLKEPLRGIHNYASFVIEDYADLLVDDSDEDCEATVRGLRKANLANPIERCRDGDEALDYLFRRGAYAEATRPYLILLDLNMPGTDGREVLETIKADPELRKIPVVVLTTSDDERDIERCYKAGANSYVQKPVNLDGFMEALRRLKDYWFEVVVMPRIES